MYQLDSFNIKKQLQQNNNKKQYFKTNMFLFSIRSESILKQNSCL